MLAGTAAMMSGQFGGKEIFCCSACSLTVVILRAGSSGSWLASCLCEEKKPYSASWGARMVSGSPKEGPLYLLLLALWRHCTEVLQGWARVCRQDLSHVVQLW